MSPSDELFLDDSVLDADPVGPDGAPLRPLHDREYRVRAYRLDDDRVLVRGAVRDQKPPHLYFAGDDDPLTVHHMQVDLTVEYPALEIVAADVRFLDHPHTVCPAITEHYRELVGLSIARGFTHKVRELFGGPRACTHTTALLQAMAPVAVQTIWSLRAMKLQDGPDDTEVAPVDEDVANRWRMNVNTCHVWADDGEMVGSLSVGEPVEVPLFAQKRMVQLGLDPDDFHRRMS